VTGGPSNLATSIATIYLDKSRHTSPVLYYQNVEGRHPFVATFASKLQGANLQMIIVLIKNAVLRNIHLPIKCFE
jgi:hypothetical protein